MLEAVKPDVVSVCSPNRFHFEHVMAALEAGCHVMCEKPPAMTPQEADEMRIAARKAGKVLAYDFHHRFALDTQLLREAAAPPPPRRRPTKATRGSKERRIAAKKRRGEVKRNRSRPAE